MWPGEAPGIEYVPLSKNSKLGARRIVGRNAGRKVERNSDSMNSTFAVTQPYALDGAHGFISRRLQINCDGAIAADCIRLARAIDDVLSGYNGVLQDPDETPVHGCFRTNVIDFFDDPGRTSRRILEYEIWFTQT